MANSNQNIETPYAFFKAIEDFFGITFGYDMAASEANTKCEKYFTEEDDSLSCEWPKSEWLWLNPPFGKLSKFVPKCAEESQTGSKIISIWPLSGDKNMIPAWKYSSSYIIHGRVWPEVRGLMLCKWGEGSSGVYGLIWNKKTLSLEWSK